MRYDKAVRFAVRAVCVTPLRTAGADGDVETVLRAHDGRAMIQGTSMAGALREWMSANGYGAEAAALFGSQKRAGRLIVSDAVFDKEEQASRPRLSIDGATGTVGNKFDVAHICPGARFSFELTWLGTDVKPEDRDEGRSEEQARALRAEKNEAELKAIRYALAALGCGGIQFGAQKTNGFGQMRAAVAERHFDMHDKNDRTAWLDDEEYLPAEPYAGGESTRFTQRRNGEESGFSLGGTASGAVVFTVKGSVKRLLVKASTPVQRGKKKGQITVNIEEGGDKILPGSSIKGAVRARVCAIAKHMGVPDGMTDDMFGRMAKDGDNGKAGRVVFEDFALKNPKTHTTSRIRINRFTGGVMGRGLFAEESLSGSVTLRVAVPNEPHMCALMLYALRDMGLGLYGLGSGSAVGRGIVSVSEISASAPDSARARLLFGENGCHADDPKGVFAKWLDALDDMRGRLGGDAGEN